MDIGNDAKVRVYFELFLEMRTGTKTNQTVKPVVFGPTFMVVVNNYHCIIMWYFAARADPTCAVCILLVLYPEGQAAGKPQDFLIFVTSGMPEVEATLKPFLIAYGSVLSEINYVMNGDRAKPCLRQVAVGTAGAGYCV